MKTTLKQLESNRSWKLRNPEWIREYQRKRNNLIQSVPELHAKKLKQDRESRQRHSKKWAEYDRNRDKVKTNARAYVRTKIYRGQLLRIACEICGCSKSHAHHDDYTKPTQVRWLCAKHHKQYHERIKNAAY